MLRWIVPFLGDVMPIGQIKRRAFVAALGSAAAWPPMGRAQQSEQMRRVGSLMNRAADDAPAPGVIRVFDQGLAKTIHHLDCAFSWRFVRGDLALHS